MVANHPLRMSALLLPLPFRSEPTSALDGGRSLADEAGGGKGDLGLDPLGPADPDPLALESGLSPWYSGSRRDPSGLRDGAAVEVGAKGATNVGGAEYAVELRSESASRKCRCAFGFCRTPWGEDGPKGGRSGQLWA